MSASRRTTRCARRRWIRRASSAGRTSSARSPSGSARTSSPRGGIRSRTCARSNASPASSRAAGGSRRPRPRDGVPQQYRATIARLERKAATDIGGVDRELAETDPLGVLSSPVLVALARSRPPDELAAILTNLHRENPSAHLAAEETLNELGYGLLAAKKNDAAIAVFRLNTELYPSSGNTFDSLAETYLKLGNEAKARELYARALAAQPDYPNAKAARRIVEGTDLRD
jgi:predicted Zn-dependent protease